MKKLLISAGALAALALSTPAVAATNTATANATVNIVSPLTLTNNSGLNFGTVVGPFSGEVIHVAANGTRDPCPVTVTCSGNASVSAATFSLHGTGGQAVVLTIPNSVTLNGSVSGTLPVDLTGDKPANPTLDSSGDATFAIGGKLTIASGTVDGVYSNTFDVTANYQ